MKPTECNKSCKYHCHGEHDKLLKEKLRLELECEKLKRQIAQVQVEARVNKAFTRAVANQTSMEKCEFLVKIECLKELNIELQKELDELKENMKSKDVEINKMTNAIRNIVTKFAPVSFRHAIEKLKKEKYQSPTLSNGYLDELWSYFSSFVHFESTNQTEIVEEDMREFVQFIFANNEESIEKIFRFAPKKNQKPKDLKIILLRTILIEIIEVSTKNDVEDNSLDKNSASSDQETTGQSDS